MTARGSGAWQEAHYGPGCKGSTLTIGFCGTRITVHAATVAAFEALARVLDRHCYPVRRQDTAAKVCRTITGGTRLSNHAYGTAVDVNWQTNPYGPRLVTDMPAEMIAEVEALRTAGGVPLFRWGGRYSRNKDAMHFEVMATPAEIAAGIVDPTAAPPDQEDDDMPLTPADIQAVADAVTPRVVKEVVGVLDARTAEILDTVKGEGSHTRAEAKTLRDGLARVVREKAAELKALILQGS